MRDLSLGEVVAGLVGGVAGAFAGGLLVRMGVKPRDAALGVAVAGGVGVVALEGTGRAVSAGVAATGVSQLALAWLHREKLDRVRIEVRRQGVSRRWDWAREFDRAMARAREEIAMEEEAIALREQYEEEERNASAGADVTPDDLGELSSLFAGDDQAGDGDDVGDGDVG